jgi:predicted RNase H-like HicB family nuclease
MDQKIYQVETFWDQEAKVWVANSEDILGLSTEANSLENLTEKLKDMIPELLILNQQIPENYQGEIALEIITHRQELIKVA